MDKKKLEDIFKPSVMERMNEIQRQIDPLHQIRSSTKISEMMEKNARVSSVANIGEIARKAFQQSGLDFISLENQSMIARYADLGFQNTIMPQDTFLEMTKGMSANNNDLMSVKERMIQSIGGTSVYEDMIASANLVRRSIEPYRGTFDKARILFEASEPFSLAREIKSQATSANFLSSEYSKIFEQFESVHNLESFKAITRLKNFPSEKLWTKNYDEALEIKEDSLAEAKNIDAMISDEVSSVDDFNDLSEKIQRSLVELSLSYYQLLIINYIYIITILKDQISNSLKYSNMEFRFVGLSSKVLVGACFINFQPDFNSICNSILASILLESFKQDEKK